MPAFQGMWPRWRQVLHLAGHRGALCYAPNRGRKATYTNPGTTPMPGPEATAALVRRYLRAYGPATPVHFAQWLAAPRGWAGELFDGLARAGAIEKVDLEGCGTAWVEAGDTLFSSAAPAVCGCSPTSTRSASRPGPASCSSPARRTPAHW